MLRYPGSKTKLLHAIAPRLSAMLRTDGVTGFADVFVGGGSVLCEIARLHPGLALHANDKDPLVAALWSVIAGDSAPFARLVGKIRRARVSVELHREMRQQEAGSEVDRAFQAIFLNRTSFSGILKASPIGGASQNGRWKVGCRWNAETLVSQLRTLRALLRGRLTVTSLDVSELGILDDARVVAYVDPPYFHIGHALYRHHMSAREHKLLARRLVKRTGWLASYDDCDEIRKLYRDASISEVDARYSVRGAKLDWTSKVELLVGPRVNVRAAKRQAVLAAIGEHRDATDGSIALRLDVSREFVNRVRSENGSHDSDRVRRVVRSGTAYEMRLRTGW